MITIGLLLPENCVLTTVAGTIDLVTKANQIGPEGDAHFELKLLSSAVGKRVRTDSGIHLTSNAALATQDKLDWLIIPALGFDVHRTIMANRKMIPWIAEHHAKGTAVISYCTGAFLLAETGLLDGKKAVTHWYFQDKFEKDYPLVSVLSDKIIIDEGNIYMCGGSGLYSNMVLYLIGKFLNKEMAVQLSKFALLDLNRTAIHFAIFNGQKRHSDKKVLEIQHYLENNFKHNISLDQIAESFNISKRTLARNFKANTGNTVIEYLQRIRIEFAKKQLEQSTDRVSEICYECGYEDLQFFNKTFKKYVGLGPNIYRNKFNLELVERN